MQKLVSNYVAHREWAARLNAIIDLLDLVGAYDSDHPLVTAVYAINQEADRQLTIIKEAIRVDLSQPVAST